eukprot:5660289-Alexandrium_andersonii.AAC.1
MVRVGSECINMPGHPSARRAKAGALVITAQECMHMLRKHVVRVIISPRGGGQGAGAVGDNGQ